MTLQNEKLYRNTRLPVVTVFTVVDHAKNEKGFKYVSNRVRNVARLFKGKLNFNVANAKDFVKEMNQKYEFEESYATKLISVGLRNGTVYHAMQQEDFSTEALKQFVLDFQAGLLEGSEQVSICC